MTTLQVEQHSFTPCFSSSVQSKERKCEHTEASLCIMSSLRMAFEMLTSWRSRWSSWPTSAILQHCGLCHSSMTQIASSLVLEDVQMIRNKSMGALYRDCRVTREARVCCHSLIGKLKKLIKTENDLEKCSQLAPVTLHSERRGANMRSRHASHACAYFQET